MNKTLIKRVVRNDLIEQFKKDSLYIQDKNKENVFYPKDKKSSDKIIQKINSF